MVKRKFSSTWLGSTQPRKQRKYRYNAPLHLQQKLVHTHLSPLLRKKYHLRSIQIRKGDKVKILRGQFKKKEGIAEQVILKRGVVFVNGMEIIKKDGGKILFPLSPSVLMITELELKDRRRREKLEAKIKLNPASASPDKNPEKIVPHPSSNKKENSP